ARHRAVGERPVGRPDPGTTRFRYPVLDGRGQLPHRARRRTRRRGGRRNGPGGALRMTRVSVDLIDSLAPMVEPRVREAARRLPHLRYADVRLEVSEGKGAGAENGTPKYSGDDYGFALGARVLAGDREVAPGYVGQTLGTADLDDLHRARRGAGGGGEARGE